MQLTNLFWQRFIYAQKRNAKYLRLLFNEHFVLFLMILLGGLIMGYRSILLQPASAALWQNDWCQWGVGAWFLLGLQLGQYVTHIQAADCLFLLGQDRMMTQIYLKQALKSSYGFAIVWQLVFFASALPIMIRLGLANTVNLIGLAVFLLSYKLLLLWRQRRELLLSRQKITLGERWLDKGLYQSLVPAVLIWPILFLLAPISLTVLVIWLLILLVIWFRYYRINPSAGQADAIDWRRAIQVAQLQEQRLLHFFSLFAEVPNQAKSIKRRRYLDPLIDRLSSTGGSFDRLLLTQLVRNNEILPLILRLWLVGIIILAGIGQVPSWLTAIIAAMLVYLVNFQILPLFIENQRVLWTRLMPMTKALQIQAFNRLLVKFSLMTTVLAVLASLLKPSQPLASLAGGLLMTVFLYLLYVPRILNKTIPNGG